MRVAFVFADFAHKHFDENVAIVNQEFGTFMPLGLGYAAAIAECAGHETIIIDAHAEKLSPAQVVDRLRPFQPQLLGFLLTTYMFHDTRRYITYLKKETGLPVVVGNVNMELYPRETMSYPEIDFGIIGSALDNFPALLSALEKGGPIPNVPGLCKKENGQVVINEPASMAEDFDRLPFPKRDGLPHPLYHSVMSKRTNQTIMVTAKGCTGHCTFCSIHETPYAVRRPSAVVDEIEECVVRHGIHEIEIFDPSFTIDRARVTQICEGVIARGLDVDFACRARVDQVDPALLGLMARAGFKRILYGLELGEPEVLAATRKNITLQQIRDSVRATQDAGIAALGFFLIGAPGETRASVEETVRFALNLNLDYAQFHRVMAKPCTLLHDQIKQSMGFDYWREYVLGNQPEMRLPSPWTELTEDEIERLTYQAYHRFYMRPAYLWKTITGIRSWNELRRYIRSGLGLVFGKSDVGAK